MIDEWKLDQEIYHTNHSPWAIFKNDYHDFDYYSASSIIKVFNMTAARTGINEKEAQDAGYDYEKVILSPANHATYHPGATIITLKVLYDKKTLNILGAQAIGYEGVDKRIDVIAQQCLLI